MIFFPDYGDLDEWYALRFWAYIKRVSLRISALFSRKSLRFSAFFILFSFGNDN